MCDPRVSNQNIIAPLDPETPESVVSTNIISVKLFIIKNLQPVETCDPRVSNPPGDARIGRLYIRIY